MTDLQYRMVAAGTIILGYCCYCYCGQLCEFKCFVLPGFRCWRRQEMTQQKKKLRILNREEGLL